MIEHFSPPVAHAKIPPLSLASKVGDMVFISGTPGYDENMELSPSFEKQFSIALRSFIEMLEKTGCTTDTIVKINVFLTRPSDIAEMNRQYALAFGPAPYPARTTVIVRGLPDPEMLVELDCIAMTKASQKR